MWNLNHPFNQRIRILLMEFLFLACYMHNLKSTFRNVQQTGEVRMQMEVRRRLNEELEVRKKQRRKVFNKTMHIIFWQSLLCSCCTRFRNTFKWGLMLKENICRQYWRKQLHKHFPRKILTLNATNILHSNVWEHGNHEKSRFGSQVNFPSLDKLHSIPASVEEQWKNINIENLENWRSISSSLMLLPNLIQNHFGMNLTLELFFPFKTKLQCYCKRFIPPELF